VKPVEQHQGSTLARPRTATPSATVVIPTRNRPHRVVTAVSSVLASAGADFDLIVVDQSDDESTRVALEPFAERPNVRYLRTATRGSAMARNVGIAEARTEVIGLTDDDCAVPANWVRELVGAFEADSRIGIVFGDVVAAPHDPEAGFIPAYVRREPCVARTARERHLADGMSACMGMRRSAWETVGGFDPMLGAGAPLKSAAEGDFALRALRAGYFVTGAPQLTVEHHGFRAWAEGHSLIQRYWYGTGAMLAKPVKGGEWSAWPVALRLAWQWAFRRSPVAASLGPHPRRWMRLSAFLRGFATGAVTPVDRSTGLYRGPDRDPVI
jgi:GT2 family glycosyltransferase